MNTPAIHPRDLIAGLQKGLALMQLFSAEQPRLECAAGGQVVWPYVQCGAAVSADLGA